MKPKNKLCKVMNSCSQYLAGKSCGFDHVECKFGKICSKEGCNFYHSDKNNPSTQAKPAQRNEKFDRQCRNGLGCQRFKKGQCSFRHEGTTKQSSRYQLQQPPRQQTQQPVRLIKRSKISKPCQFGVNCNKKEECLFSHQNIETCVLRASPIAPQIRCTIQNELCLKFINGVCKDCQCRKLHQFTTQNTVKREFMAQEQRLLNCCIYRSFRSEETLYILQFHQQINFYKLISSSQLLGTNQSDKTERILFANLPQSLNFPEQIKDIYSCNTEERDTVLFASQQHLYFYQPKKGSYEQFVRSVEPINGVALMGGSIFISFTDSLIRQFKLNNNQCFQEVRRESLEHEKSFIFLRRSVKKICGEYIIAAGTHDSKIWFYDQSLRMKVVPIPNSACILDCQFFVKDGYPFCFCIAKKIEAYEILAVDLITFEITSVLRVEAAQPLLRIFESNQHLFIHAPSMGVLIYKGANFTCPVGLLNAQLSINRIDFNSQGDIILAVDKSFSIFRSKK